MNGMSAAREPPCGTTGSHSEEDNPLARQTNTVSSYEVIDVHKYWCLAEKKARTEGPPCGPD